MRNHSQSRFDRGTKAARVIEVMMRVDQISEYDFEYLIGGHEPAITKPEFVVFRARIAAMTERVRTMAQQGEGREAIAEALSTEFNWGGGLAAGIIRT